MNKKITLFLIIIIFMNLLAGCWSAREITELSIAMGIGIDKFDDEYLVTVELINPSDIAIENPSTRTGVTTYQTKGKTIFEALRKLTKKTPRKIYMSHVQTIVLGEEFAKDGISKALDFFSRDHEMRTDFYIMVARNEKAEDVLSILTPLEKIPAINMYSSLEMSKKAWASTYHVQLDELISTLVSDGRNPVLTGITLEGDKDKGTTKENVERIRPLASVDIDHIAVFKEDKLVGWLDEEESKGLNFIDNNVESTIINVPCDKDDVLSVELIRSETKIRCKVENEEPFINIEVKSEGNVGEVMCDTKLLESEVIYELEERVEKVIKTEMETVIKKAQKVYKSDIFGFGEVIHRTNPKLWKKLKDNWSERFEDLAVNINVDVKIRRLGTVTESFQGKAKE